MNDQDLGRLLCHSSLLVRRSLEQAIAQATEQECEALSGRNFWVLRYLSEHSHTPVFQKDLETAFQVRRSTVSGTVELMEQKGLLVRRPVNGDARLTQLCLTPRGQEVLQAATHAAQNFEDRLRQILPPHRYNDAMEALTLLCAALDASAEEVNPEKERND